MSVKTARVSDAIEIAYEEVAGDPSQPPLLMIHGLGMQMIGWRDGFLQALADRGLRVIRFDNRDVGLSTHLPGMPDLRAMLAGDMSSAPYTLEDMAADATGLMDALEIDSAHVVGVSMGGMIAQTLAAAAPDRVRSLTSVMASTGEHEAMQPTPEASATLLAPRPRNVEEAQDRAVEGARVIGTPGMLDEEWSRELARLSFERAYDPEGFARQLGAIWRSGDRTASLAAITAPTLVIHGEVDPLVPLLGGRATHAGIDGAELLIVDGMGHDLPRPLWPVIVDAIAEHVLRAEAARSGGSPAAAGLPKTA